MTRFVLVKPSPRGQTFMDIFVPDLWAAETLAQLKPRLGMAARVHRNFEPLVAQQGDTINTRIPGLLTAKAVTPDTFTATAPSATNVTITLNRWREVVIQLGDREMSMGITSLLSIYAPLMAQALATDIEDALIELYRNVYQWIGTPGTPMDNVARLGTNLKERFDVLQIPPENRYVALTPAVENFFNQVFYQAFVSGSADQQRTGEVGVKFGMNYFGIDRLPRHTAGTWANESPLVDGGHSAGSTTLVIKAAGASRTILAGDLFSIDTGAGAGQYVVTANTTSTSGGAATLHIAPPLRGAVAGDTPVNEVASHNFCLAFHRDAFALVTRPLDAPTAPGAAVSVVQSDGIGLRSTVWYEPKDVRTYVRMDILYGVAAIDPRKAFRCIY